MDLYSTCSVGDAEPQYQFAHSFFTLIRPSAVDPNIKWEATRSFNLGLDFGFNTQVNWLSAPDLPELYTRARDAGAPS